MKTNPLNFQFLEDSLNKLIELSGDNYSFAVEEVEKLVKELKLSAEFCDNCEKIRINKSIYECETGVTTTTGYICEDCYMGLMDREVDY